MSLSKQIAIRRAVALFDICRCSGWIHLIHHCSMGAAVSSYIALHYKSPVDVLLWIQYFISKMLNGTSSTKTQINIVEVHVTVL
jgi:uncharacterized membrane protein